MLPKKKGQLKKYDGTVPSLYVGETARSLHERSREHIADMGAKTKKSHIWKHQLECHGGSQNHAFIFKIVDTPKSALSRQIGEAVKIRRWGAILNAKGEFNRCHITRLTLGADEEQSKTDVGEGEESENWIQSQGRRWEQRKTKQREQKEPNKANDGSRIIGRAPVKRSGDKGHGGRTSTTKKRKFKLVDINWGSTDVREKLRLDSLTAEGSLPSLAERVQNNEFKLATKIHSTQIATEDSPPSLAEGAQDKELRLAAEGSPPSLAEGMQNNEFKLATEINPPQIATEGSPPSLAEGVQDKELRMAAEMSPPLLAAKNSQPSLAGLVQNKELELATEESPPSLAAAAKDECVIRKRYCNTHNAPAIMKKERKRSWTKIVKTGLYAYRTTQSVLWICPQDSSLNLMPKNSQSEGIKESHVVNQANISVPEERKFGD